MKWVFRKEKYYKDMRIAANVSWAETHDGREVVFNSTKQTTGECGEVFAHRDWCEEIKEDGMKTWVHERAGVEPNEPFSIDGNEEVKFWLDESGYLWSQEQNNSIKKEMYSSWLADILNDPNLIIHLLRLTPEQVEVLKALRTLGFEWVARDEDGTVYAYLGKPLKDSCSWHGTCHSPMKVINTHRALSSLVSWSDPSPLRIEDALKGVE